MTASCVAKRYTCYKLARAWGCQLLTECLRQIPTLLFLAPAQALNRLRSDTAPYLLNSSVTSSTVAADGTLAKNSCRHTASASHTVCEIMGTAGQEVCGRGAVQHE